jgi:hypothetical protein
VPGWAGSDYGRFFLRVLEELCFEVRFVSGWEYSMGATKEFLRSQELGIPCFNENGETLTARAVVGLLEAVIYELKVNDIDDRRYVSRLSSLRDFV